MSKLNVFFKLAKVDAANRLVYGVLAQEVADGQREIMDYDSSKPEFEKWSGDIAKASDGKSVGNVRAMHGKVAAGKLESINFDDAAKSIEGVAKIVDDNEWEKVEQGVYTGFSIGGKYGKTWKDPTDPLVKRYTAIPNEVSLVDKPCIPTATFTMVKADGATEERLFKQADPAPEPKQVWQAKDGTTFEKKADAIAHDEGKAPAAELISPEAQAALDLANKLGKALDKQEGVENTSDRLEKAMYDVSRCASICSDLKWLADCLIKSENNAELRAIIGTLGEFLKKLVDEEVANLTAEKMETTELEKLEKLSPFSDLVKAAFEAKKKKKKEAEAEEESEEEEAEEVEKLQKIAAERDSLQKALVEITPKLQSALDRIEKLEQQPQAPKGVVRAVSKSEDSALAGAAGALQKALDSGPLSPEQARNGVQQLLDQAAAASTTK